MDDLDAPGFLCFQTGKLLCASPESLPKAVGPLVQGTFRLHGSQPEFLLS